MSDSEQPQKSRSIGWVILIVIIATVVVIGVAAALWQTFVPDADIWTNDAQIEAHYVTVAPRVSGQVAEVLVADNEVVEKGQPLARLDARPYETAVAEAKAQVGTARARVDELAAEIARQPALIDQAQAVVERDRASADFAERNAKRYRELASANGISEESRQRQDADARSASSQLAADRADLAAAKSQLKVLKAQKEQAEASLAVARARLADARLNLSYTDVVAPKAGVVGERAARPGAWVDPGTALMAVVPLQNIYVQANYRETDLTHVAPGQPVSIHVDAFPDDPLTGHVDSLAPATGVTFSPIAPDNATGNFTKVVQRLPIKITIDPGQGAIARLKQGLSVETTIHTDFADVDSNLGVSGASTDRARLEAARSGAD
ncbi:HlyD family secretion protein [uncultured Salinisphaera sp.]|uniref:HlyD family secretion protein n=1 Tax=uncultured Salinisphaera sp. TaxID=359372 RepID=UPI0032B28E3A|tara:strand:+ start:3350 stop:4489 length:1140 start_codon:yes stop_codon:yes gene_type:complete